MEDDSGTFMCAEFEDNLREQRDELEALQSIYQDTNQVKVLCAPQKGACVAEAGGACVGGAYVGGACVGGANEHDNHHPLDYPFYVLHLSIPVHVEKKVRVEAWLPYEAQDAEQTRGKSTSLTVPQYQRTTSGRHLHSSCQVGHLTPLSMQVTLPTCYPSTGPPVYTLSCLWLDGAQLTSLCAELDSLWSEQMPVLFTWLDWLHNNTLRYLGLLDMVHVGVSDEGEEDTRDPRALPGGADPRQDLLTLLQFDMEMESEQFERTIQTCAVCFDEKLGSEFFRLAECGHHMCRVCAASYCDMHVKDGTVQQLSCPCRGCECSLPVSLLQSVLSDDDYQRWERLQLQRALDTMGDIVWCPRCVFPVVSDASHHAQCTQCLYSFCTNCRASWHHPAKCKTAEDMLKELGEAADGQEPSKLTTERVRQLKLEYLSTCFVKKISKPCPRCKQDIEKYDGCNKVTCTVCGSCMCWLCGHSIQGYEHFHKGQCSLFELPDHINAALRHVYNRPVPEGAVRLQQHLEENPGVGQGALATCPRCRQRNLKEKRNNHIRCWSCKLNFCFLCKESFRQLSDHFVRGACSQHSD